MSITKGNIRNIALALPLLLAGTVFFSCHDPIFEDINKESAINDERIKGSMSAFVIYDDYIYCAPANEGVIHRKKNSASSLRSRGGWDDVRCPETPVYLAEEDGYLYMLTTTFENGSGASEGIYMPTGYYEYRTKNPGDWGSRINTYGYDMTGDLLPSKYKNQHTKVRASDNTVYSMSTNTNVLYRDNEAILYADQKEVKVGSWWCIAASKDQIILGTNTGLYHMQMGSTDINTDDAPSDKSTARSIFSGMTILTVYVEGMEKESSSIWKSSGINETDAVIYVFATGPGSGYASQNGLYSYIPGEGWDSEF